MTVWETAWGFLPAPLPRRGFSATLRLRDCQRPRYRWNKELWVACKLKFLMQPECLIWNIAKGLNFIVVVCIGGLGLGLIRGRGGPNSAQMTVYPERGRARARNPAWEVKKRLRLAQRPSARVRWGQGQEPMVPRKEETRARSLQPKNGRRQGPRAQAQGGAKTD